MSFGCTRMRGPENIRYNATGTTATRCQNDQYADFLICHSHPDRMIRRQLDLRWHNEK